MPGKVPCTLQARQSLLKNMKTILEKVTIQIPAGQTVSIQLPEPFRIKDSLFLLAHNMLSETVQVTISNAEGNSISQNVTLNSFPTFVVFPHKAAQDSEYVTASFTSFKDFEGNLTFRIKNPPHIVDSFRK